MGQCCAGPYHRGRPPSFPEPWECLAKCTQCGNLIPPVNCFETIVLAFQCGGTCAPTDEPTCPDTSIDDDEIKAEVVKYSVPNPMAIQDLPVFNKERMQNGAFAFALDDSCTIPCQESKVTLHAVGPCCIEVEGCQLFAAGSGLITSHVDTETVQVLTGMGLRPQVKINGRHAPYHARDGQLLNVELITKICGKCELLSVSPQGPDIGENICPSTSSTDPGPLWIRKGNKIYLNKKSLIEKVNQARMVNVSRRQKYVIRIRRKIR